MENVFFNEKENVVEEFDLAREEIIAEREMKEVCELGIKMNSWCRDYENSIISICDQLGVDVDLIDVCPSRDYNEHISPKKAARAKIKRDLRKIRYVL